MILLLRHLYQELYPEYLQSLHPNKLLWHHSLKRNVPVVLMLLYRAPHLCRELLLVGLSKEHSYRHLVAHNYFGPNKLRFDFCVLRMWFFLLYLLLLPHLELICFPCQESLLLQWGESKDTPRCSFFRALGLSKFPSRPPCHFRAQRKCVRRQLKLK